MKVAIIIPTYNERENIGKLVEKILSQKINNAYIIIVDDNSPDGTGEIADEFAKKHKKVEVIHRLGKLGLGTAYVAGFKRAKELGAQVVATMDADFFHNPRYLPRLLAEIGGSDLVVGSRYVRGGKILGFSLWRQVLSRGAQVICRLILGIPVFDSTSGFRVYKRQVIEKISPETIKSSGYSFLIEAVFRAQRAGFSICEVPIVAPARSVGSSKISQKEILNALATILRLGLLES